MNETRLEEKYFQNGSLKSGVRYLNSKLDSKTQHFDSLGTLLMENNYTNNLRNGWCKRFDKTGKLLSIQNVFDEDDLMIITKSGVTIRMHVDTIRTMGRAAQGVRLINLKSTAAIAAIARVPRTEDEDEEIEVIEAADIPLTDATEDLGTEIETSDED